MDNLKSLLTVPYKADNFKKFSVNFLKNLESVPLRENKAIPAAFKATILSFTIFGSYKDENDENVIVMSVKVKNNSSAQKAQRQFISYLLANEYIDYKAALVAYYDEVRTNWKLSFVTVEYSFGDRGVELKFKPAKRFSFLVGTDEPTRTYVQQLNPIYEKNSNPTLAELTDAFSVSKLSNDFYDDYKKKYFELYDYLSENKAFINEAHRLGYKSEEDTDRFVITFCKKTLGQIVFLHFVQKKGWLGVTNIWGDGDKHYLMNSTKMFSLENYFDDYLEPLFYEGLNVKRDKDLYLGKKVPFLNGGLFHPIEGYDWQNTNFEIPNSYWFNAKETGLLNILSQYNFTVDEADPEEQEVAIDPEMLGKIFEKLLDASNRSDLGAFYTPREIVHFMCEEALASKISVYLGINYESMINYIRYGDALKDSEFIQEFAEDIDKFVSELTIVDPAVGSGAFLVGMLTQIVKLRMNLLDYTDKEIDKYSMKMEAIQKSLYGVDVEYDAVEIAKLRLWLSLIVDQVADVNAPRPLPNLNFHLRVGNSLVDTYEGIKLWSTRWRGTKKKEKTFNQMNIFNVETVTDILQRLKDAKVKYFSTSDEAEKIKLSTQIEREQIELIRSELVARGNFDTFYELEDMLKKQTKPFFIWELEFEEVFEDGGFDIVIANPPYIKEYTNVHAFDNLRNDPYYQGKTDLWNIFACKSLDLLKDDGIETFIAPNNWTTNFGASKMRNKVLKDSRILKFIDFGSSMIFDSASIQTMIYVLKKEEKHNLKKEYEFPYTKVIEDIFTDIELTKVLNSPDSTENIYYSQSIVPADFIDKYITFADPMIQSINNIIKNKADMYLTKKEISQGIVVPQTELNKKGQAKLGDSFVVGQGIFVLSALEMAGMHLTEREKKVLKPLVQAENIANYSIDMNTVDRWIIYGDESFRKNIDNYPNLKKHIEQFIPVLTSDNKPYGLHRARKSNLFEAGERIFSLRKCAKPTFSYIEDEACVLQTFNVITQDRVNNKFLIGFLNSKVVQFWLKNNGKMQGSNYQVDKEPISMIPIPVSSKLSEIISEIVATIINSKDHGTGVDTIDELLFDYYGFSSEQLSFLKQNIQE